MSTNRKHKPSIRGCKSFKRTDTREGCFTYPPTLLIFFVVFAIRITAFAVKGGSSLQHLREAYTGALFQVFPTVPFFETKNCSTYGSLDPKS
jgi:hypothetical protein